MQKLKSLKSIDIKTKRQGQKTKGLRKMWKTIKKKRK